MRNLISILFTTFFISTFLQAQPTPCGNPASMTSYCKDACIICDIDGFTGINNSKVPGEAPKGFCTTTVHNAQWIAFMAGSTNLTLKVSVFNCKNGGNSGGLEVGIYKSTDCKNFQLVSNCDGDIANNTSQNFTNTTPLVVGQYYYFVMDGNGGDICNYTISVVSGSTKVNPLANSGIIEGDFELCKSGKYKFQNKGVVGAIDYEWKLDNVVVGKGLQVEVDLPKSGTYNLCCTASNVCDKAQPSCQTITVLEPKTSAINAGICVGDCYKIADSLLCKAGTHFVITKAKNGCDSTITVNLVEYPTKVSNLNLNFCEGDTVKIGQKNYTKGGVYQEKFQTTNGCDSLLNLTLNEIICTIKGSISTKNVDCFGGNNGSVNFSINKGTPPFTYTWEEISNKTLNGSGNISALNSSEVINQLPIGTYFINISDNFGNKSVLQADILQPDSLTAEVITSNYGNYQVQCYNSMNGSITINPKGGTSPYSYLWQNKATTNIIKDLAKGTYQVTVTDDLGCSIQKSVTLNAPTAIIFQAIYRAPTCEGLNTGKIIVKNLSGGIPPYTYILNGVAMTDTTLLSRLPEGEYDLYMLDSKGCKSPFQAIGNFQAPKIPVITVSPTQTIKLGEPVYISVSANVTMDSIIWSNIAGLSCYDCENPLANPSITSNYEVKVVSEDGCATKGLVKIIVNKNKKIFVPNIFSPSNSDGINDKLTVFAPPSVAKIKSFSVFDRWGNQVFKNTDFAANDLSSGWDGSYKGVVQNESVFTWVAQIEFLDGELEFYAGDVLLAK